MTSHDRSRAPGPAPDTTAAKPVITLRVAPTPRREWSRLDALLYNLMTMNLAVMLAMPVLAGLAFFPAGSLPGAILIAGVFCCAEAAVYVFLASSMPRSGGDYLFQSRLLSPGVATVFAFTGVVLGGALWMAIAGWFAAMVAVGPLLWAIGRLTDTPEVLSVASFIQSSHGVMLLSGAVICWSALVDLLGLRPYARLQRLFWPLGAGAMLAVVIVVLSLGPDAVGDDAPYRLALSRASDLGFDAGAGGSSLGATLALVPVAAFALIYPGWSVQQAGELREAASLRAETITILGAEAITVAMSAVMTALLLRVVDREGLSAGAWLYFQAPEAMPYPVLPFFWFFDGGLWPSGMVVICLAVLFNAWFWMWVPDITLAASRVLLATALQRSLPRWLGDVTGRRRLPVKAVVTFSLLCLAPAALFSYTELWRLTLSVTLLNVAAFAITCGAAAAQPFVDRELYRESTAAPYEVLGIPTISWCGGAFVLFAVFLVYRFVADGRLALGVDRWVLLTFVAGAYVASSLLYWSVRRFRRGHEGPDLEIIYRRVSRSS